VPSIDVQTVAIVVVGLTAGWLSESVTKSTRFGALGDMLFGVLGAFLGAWVEREYRLLPDLSSPTAEAVLAAMIGAVVLLGGLAVLRSFTR
jgi:uncharacterized membrane protein YeaQ/YmgE (transglycosylase-associated protein family)